MSNTLSPALAEQFLVACTPDVLAALRVAAVEPEISAFTVAFRRQIDGCAGYGCPKIPVTLLWKTSDGRTGEILLMMKVFPWGRSEGQIHRYLTPLDAPIPRCYGVLQLPPEIIPDGWMPSTEAILLEFLPHIGYQWDNLEDRIAIAKAYARLHSIPPNLPGAPPWKEERYQDSTQSLRDRLRHVLDYCRGGELGPELAEAGEALAAISSDTTKWLAETARRADSLPTGLTHQDASYQNTGWREERTDTLIIDLQRMRIGALLSDLDAAFPNSDYSPEDLRVAEVYCAALRGHGGPPLTPEQVWTGVTLTKSLRRVGFLSWALERSIDGRVDWTEDTEEGKRWYRNKLLCTLQGIEQDVRAFRARTERL